MAGKSSREDINRAKRDAAAQLLKIPGVTGVGTGRKKTMGQDTGEIAILVHVERKKALDQLPPDQVIPTEINGVKTDVVESGKIRLLANTGGTVLTSENTSGQGTLGCFAFTDEAEPKAVLVTNQHVVMDGTDVTPLGGEVGPSICSVCSPCCSKVLGHISAVELNADLDGAAALLKPGVQIVPEVQDIGVVNGTHAITQAESDSGVFTVRMYSRMQKRVVTGTVTDIGLDGSINQHDGTLHRNYTDQILITSTTPFALPGDSGSAVFDSANNVVGLLFGGNGTTRSLACHVAKVESLLHIRIATGTASGQVFTVPAAAGGTTSGEAITLPAASEGKLSPRAERLRLAHQQILSTRQGRIYNALYLEHADEVRRLVNHNKRVATVWHRNQGPAFLVHLSNCIMDGAYEIPAHVKDVSLQELGRNMHAILMKYGSAALQADLTEHASEVLAFAAACRRSEDVMDHLRGEEEACPAT